MPVIVFGNSLFNLCSLLLSLMGSGSRSATIGLFLFPIFVLKAFQAFRGRPRWQVVKLEDPMRSIDSAGLYSSLYFDRVLLKLLVTLKAVRHTSSGVFFGYGDMVVVRVFADSTVATLTKVENQKQDCSTDLTIHVLVI